MNGKMTFDAARLRERVALAWHVFRGRPTVAFCHLRDWPDFAEGCPPFWVHGNRIDPGARPLADNPVRPLGRSRHE